MDQGVSFNTSFRFFFWKFDNINQIYVLHKYNDTYIVYVYFKSPKPSNPAGMWYITAMKYKSDTRLSKDF